MEKERDGYLVKAGDIRELFNMLGLEIQPESIFYGLSVSDVDGDAGEEYIDNTYAELINDETFLELASIISDPDTKATMRIAGAQGYVEHKLQLNKNIGDIVVAVENTAEGDFVILKFNNYNEYIELWQEQFIGTGNEQESTFISPNASVSDYVHIMNTIDAYRYTTYKNMLDRVYSENPNIKTKEFYQVLVDSIENPDMRWLLPSFLNVTPNMYNYKLEIGMEQMENLISNDFLEFGQLESGENTLVYGDAGKLSGVEFLKSWFTSYGWEFELAHPNKNEMSAFKRLFVAPTVLTNHLFEISMGVNGSEDQASYYSYNYEGVIQHIANIFEALIAFDWKKSDHNDVEVKCEEDELENTSKINLDGPKFCFNCGFQLKTNPIFCRNCGIKVR